MLGVVCPQKGETVRVERIRIAQLSVPCAYVTLGGRGEKRRLGRAVKLLRRAGANRILPCRGDRPQLPLPVVEALPLCRALADRLILLALAERGLQPRRAAVVLRGEYPDSDLTAAAYRLCPVVRQVVIETEHGGDGLQRRLYREFGLTVDPAAERNGLRVCFSGPPAGDALRLCTEEDVTDVCVDVPDIGLPDFLEPVPALCALWQAGLLNLGQLRVHGEE